MAARQRAVCAGDRCLVFSGELCRSHVDLSAASLLDLTSGQTRGLTASIRDLNGNLVDSGSDSTLSIHFAKTLGTGTVDGLSPDVSAVAGVALKTVTGHTAGALTLDRKSGV